MVLVVEIFPCGRQGPIYLGPHDPLQTLFNGCNTIYMLRYACCEVCSCYTVTIGACFLSLAWSKLRLCSANHRAGYFSNLACDWLSIVWAYTEQEIENGPWSAWWLLMTWCLFCTSISATIMMWAGQHICGVPQHNAKLNPRSYIKLAKDISPSWAIGYLFCVFVKNYLFIGVALHFSLFYCILPVFTLSQFTISSIVLILSPFRPILPLIAFFLLFSHHPILPYRCGG